MGEGDRTRGKRGSRGERGGVKLFCKLDQNVYKCPHQTCNHTLTTDNDGNSFVGTLWERTYRDTAGETN